MGQAGSVPAEGSCLGCAGVCGLDEEELAANWLGESGEATSIPACPSSSSDAKTSSEWSLGRFASSPDRPPWAGWCSSPAGSRVRGACGSVLGSACAEASRCMYTGRKSASESRSAGAQLSDEETTAGDGIEDEGTRSFAPGSQTAAKTDARPAWETFSSVHDDCGSTVECASVQRQRNADEPFNLNPIDKNDQRDFFTDRQMQTWIEKYAQGQDVTILFPAGQSLSCRLTIDAARGGISLHHGDKRRWLAFADLEALPPSPSDSQAQEADPDSATGNSSCTTKSSLLRDPKVSTIRVLSSGRCIAIKLASSEEALAFCFVVNNMRSRTE
eukprot:GHVT01067972.1.p1 GENE.GHVT01067972.1~~GHVT01067972.1.p1  ORF type:complete len:330 (-),score=55.61 GHVT01067972.1:350-1339(-)